jgi:two-component system KDP operon response regulator KdpE
MERVRAVLRRLEMPRRGASSFRTGEFEMDFETQEVRMRGERVSLTPTEYKLLQRLVRDAGKVQMNEALLKDIWGPEYVDEFVYLRVYVRRLREKLGDDSEHPHYIHTERGRGYRFSEPGRVVAATV